MHFFIFYLLICLRGTFTSFEIPSYRIDDK